MNQPIRLGRYSYLTQGSSIHEHDCLACRFMGQIFRHPSNNSSLIEQVCDVYLACDGEGVVIRSGPRGDYEYLKTRFALAVAREDTRWEAALRVINDHPRSASEPELAALDLPVRRKDLKALV